MKVQDFLAWLHVAELGESSEENLRTILDEVLDTAPDDGNDSLENLLEEIADQLDAPEVDIEVVLGWADRYEDLLPPRLSGLGMAEERIDIQAEELPDEEVESPRLERFRSALAGDATDREQQLAALEQQMRDDWDAYRAEPFPEEALSADSVAGHRLLQDGFVCWFDAFDLVREGKTEQSLASATEGNRLFLAVALWSDEVLEDG